MFTDLRRAPRAADRSVDLCVVGAGPAGITLVDQLLDSGMSILLAEGGGWVPRAANQTLLAGDSVGYPMNLTTGRYSAFGGAATRWGGRCAMLEPLDLAGRPWIHPSGWPIGWEELRGYYDRAMLASNFQGIWDEDEAVMQRLRGTDPVLADSALREFLWRKAGGETTRRRLGKQDGYNWGVGRRERLRAARNVEVLLQANLIDLRCGPDGRTICSALFRSLAGHEMEVHAQRFVLCCGGVENPRILMELAEKYPAALEGAEHIGRYFGQHPRGNIVSVRMTREQKRKTDTLFGRFKRIDGEVPEHEIGFALSDAAQIEHELVNASAGIYDLPNDRSSWLAAKRIKDLVRAGRFGRELAGELFLILRDSPSLLSNLWRRYVTGRELVFSTSRATIVIDLEQKPRYDSRIFLSDDRDALGRRKATVEWKVSPIEIRTARFMAERIADAFRRLDLGTPTIADWVSNGDARPGDLEGTYHFIGATRMAETGAAGVVDRDAKCFGIDNLFVMGSSIFPTGGHANPTMTIVALSCRLADHIRAQSAQEVASFRPTLSHGGGWLVDRRRSGTAGR
jgi:choline dehydrogenase-like flavoprotein